MARKDPALLLFEILKKDHDNVTRALQHMKGAPYEQKDAYFGIVHGQLTLHMQIEEKFLYPELIKFDELRPHITAAFGEHERIKEMLRTMMDEELETAAWQRETAQLERFKDQHVLREEQQIFGLAMKVVSEELLRKIGENVIAEKERGPQPQIVKTRKKREPRLEI